MPRQGGIALTRQLINDVKPDLVTGLIRTSSPIAQADDEIRACFKAPQLPN